MAKESASEKLAARAKRMAEQGLVDIKFVLSKDLRGATVESVAAEVETMYDAIDQGHTRDLRGL